jgi:hypothetical protein
MPVQTYGCSLGGPTQEDMLCATIVTAIVNIFTIPFIVAALVDSKVPNWLAIPPAILFIHTFLSLYLTWIIYIAKKMEEEE